MRRRHLLVALGVGLAAGLALTVFLERTGADPPVVPPAGSAASAPEGRARGVAALPGPLIPGRDRRSTLTVRVTRDAAPVDAAEVTAWDRHGPGWSPPRRGVTDGRGEVELPAMPGRHAVMVTAPGGTTTTAVADVPSSGNGAHLDVALGHAELAEGRVLGPGGLPVPGAAVVWVAVDGIRLPPPTAVASVADSLGRFRFPVPAGHTAELEASAPGMTREAVPHVQQPVDIHLSRAGEVVGVVEDEAHRPVPGVTVTALPALAAPVVSGAEGQFRFPAPPGRLTVHAQALDGRQALAWVTVTADGRPAELGLTLGTGSPLEGVVMDSSGSRPLAGASVTVAADPDGLPLAQVSSAGDGRFLALGLPRGRYTVVARSPGWLAGRVAGVELPRSEPVRLRLDPTATVEGMVRDGAGAPLPGASVEVAPPGPRPEVVPRQAVSGADGRYRVEGVEAGVHHVTARLDDMNAEARAFVAAGATVTRDFVLASPGLMRGQVTGPPRRWQVVFPPSTASARTDEQGRFEISLPAGRYGPLAFPDTGARVVGNEMMSGWIEVKPGEVVEVTVDPPPSDVRPDAGQRRFFSANDGISFDGVGADVRVGFLVSDSVAAVSGVRSGDLVIAINGTPVSTSLQAFKLLREHRDRVELTLRRDGQDRVVILE